MIEIQCYDHDVMSSNDFLGCACIDLCDFQSQLPTGIHDVWLPLCDEPSADSKQNQVMRLFALTPNPSRGQIRVTLERVDKSKAHGSNNISSESVKQLLRELPSLRSRQKALEQLLDSGNDIANLLVVSRSLMSEKFDRLLQQHSVLELKHENLIQRYR
jgi:hypothetical protein